MTMSHDGGFALFGAYERHNFGDWLMAWCFEGLRFRGEERNVDPERESTLEVRLDALRSGLGDDLYEELLAANFQDFDLYEVANRRLDLIRVAHEVGSRDA